jgi:hypothetical protein
MIGETPDNTFAAIVLIYRKIIVWRSIHNAVWTDFVYNLVEWTNRSVGRCVSAYE